MKKKFVAIFSAVLSLFVVVATFVAFMIANNQKTTKTFANTDDVLLNPGKGFVDYGQMIYLGAEDYVTTGYQRFDWADVQPSETEFDFQKILHKIDTYSSLNKKFAFGIMCVNTSSSKQYVTPQFVFDNGARGYDAKLEDGTYQKIPDWEDEIFLGYLDNLVKVLGETFNGNKNIAFIDILSYGNWGEQHLFHLDVEEIPDYTQTKKISPEFFKERYIKPYMEAFPDTLLFNPWGENYLNGVYEELIDEGVSLRRDGIVSYTNGLDILAKCYGKLPVVFEYAKNYKDYIPDREAYFNERLEEAIEIAKPSYIELDKDWFQNNLDYCKELANRMGYYFRLKQAQYKVKVKRNKTTKIDFIFSNDGIAPIYENCLIYVGLLDQNGNLVQKYLTDLDPKTWFPSKEIKQTVNIKFGENIEPGVYTLAVGLFESEDDENPTYLLGSVGKTANNWYAIGNVAIKK